MQFQCMGDPSLSQVEFQTRTLTQDPLGAIFDLIPQPFDPLPGPPQYANF